MEKRERKERKSTPIRHKAEEQERTPGKTKEPKKENRPIDFQRRESER